MDNFLLSPEQVKEVLKTHVKLECPKCAWTCETDTDHMVDKIAIHMAVNKGKHPITINGAPMVIIY